MPCNELRRNSQLPNEEQKRGTDSIHKASKDQIASGLRQMLSKLDRTQDFLTLQIFEARLTSRTP
ncbi:hypothetical protein BELL_0187g00170 [Botrytis elliptica]|uniref:Uncharacterized protein n=1 Tax=Botrytis elliptica TaxID=278938 RepID=A0A4Z1JQN1_9HELO|nr:hypothetical protein BELL_0187g00170 [Botrytis elliptica]